LIYLRKILLTGLLCGLFNPSLLAAQNWGMCSVPSFNFIENNNPDPEVTEIEADLLQRDETKLMRFSGQVRLERGDQRVEAEQISYDQQSELFEARGNVIFEKPDLRLTTDQLNFDQINDSGVFDAASFELSDRHARGNASNVVILDKSRSRFTDILYTTCDPGDRDWYFASDELEINDETGLGVAHHATIYFQEIPIFYLPYFQFPIDDRRITGVLTPTFLTSSANNSHLSVPIYWNIAPNFDTTFVPAWYPDRGLLYNSEHRYLFPHHRGQLEYSRIEDSSTSETRWFKKWQHTADYTDTNLTGSLLLQKVSDNDFFGDFNQLIPGSDTIDYLDRHLQLTHAGSSWRSSLLWQNYQTVDSTIAIASQPYQRLPQLTVNSQFQRQENGLQFNIQNELVRFKRDESINGDRTHLTPTLNWLSNDSWYFFQPQLQYDLTEYSLENNTLGDNSIDRILPIASIDSGLFFERSMGPDEGWLQTLEPRLYFAHIPFKNQAEIPDFDTSILADSYANFFRANRFLGADRIGDTDQVTFGLGSHIYDTDGAQLFYAGIAQVFYAENRKVSLSNTIDERKKSNIVAQIDVNPTPYLKIGAALVYNEELKELTQKNYTANWAKDGFAANAEYYFTANQTGDRTLEQRSYSVAYPVNELWTVVAKQHKSLLFNKPVENLFGLSYESCCWGLKILASQVSDSNFIETTTGLFFELTLKGLTQAGDNVNNHLLTAIPGYKTRF